MKNRVDNLPTSSKIKFQYSDEEIDDENDEEIEDEEIESASEDVSFNYIHI